VSTKVIHIKSKPPDIGQPPDSAVPPLSTKDIIVHHFIPGGPAFRKTAEQVAWEYVLRLEELGIVATKSEVMDVIRGKAEPNVLTTVVEGWIEDEKKRGVTIF